MPPKDFKPPEHVETHVYIFDRKTGEIVATHTRWTDKGAPRPAAHIGRELLASIAAGSDRAPGDLDVLEARPRKSGTELRVDPGTRKIVALRSAKKVPEIASPHQLGKP
jgi:hypothetical protein